MSKNNVFSICMASLVAQLVKNPPAMQETPVRFLGPEDCWRRDRLSTPVFLGLPGGSAGKESACNVGDLDSIHELGAFPGEGEGCPLQYPGLENSMDCVVHGVAKSWTRLSDFHSHLSTTSVLPSSKDIPWNHLCLSVFWDSPARISPRWLRG